LAIGIGASTGDFSVVNALLLRSLPFEGPARRPETSWEQQASRKVPRSAG
jgi:hypothetical protein